MLSKIPRKRRRFHIAIFSHSLARAIVIPTVLVPLSLSRVVLRLIMRKFDAVVLATIYDAFLQAVGSAIPPI